MTEELINIYLMKTIIVLTLLTPICTFIYLIKELEDFATAILLSIVSAAAPITLFAGIGSFILAMQYLFTPVSMLLK